MCLLTELVMYAMKHFMCLKITATEVWLNVFQDLLGFLYCQLLP